MSSTLETPASAPSEKTTLLVSRLRTTLDTQWDKFDKSLLSLKSLSPQYQSMRSGYDWLKSDLSRITDDVALKQNTSIQAKLDEFLVKIAKHLTDTTRDRQYDGILTETQSQVASLSSEIYGKKSESWSETLPNPALLAAGGVGAAALASWSVLDINQVAEWAQKQIQEKTWQLASWVQAKVKEPWMMGDVFRDLEKKATSWIKDLTTPPTGSWIDDPWENITHMLKKWFAPLLAGWFGIKLDGTKSPEVTPGQKPEVKLWESTEKVAQTALVGVSYKGFTRIFARPTLDPKANEKVFTPESIDQLITIQAFRDLKYRDLLALHTKYTTISDKSWIRKDLGITDSNISADMVAFVISRMATGKWKEFIDKHALPGQSLDTIKVSDIFMRLHKNIHIGAKFDNLKPSKPITGPTDFMEYLWEVGKKIDLPLSGTDGVMTHPDYRETIANLGVTASMAGYIIATPGTDINKINSQTIRDSNIADEKWKEWMKKLLDFWSKFQVTLAEKFSFWNKEKYLEYFKKHGVDLGDVFRMYLITGGNPSADALNGTQEAYMYMKLWNILGKDPTFRWQYFNQPLISALFEEGSNIKISPEAKHVLSTLFANVLDETMTKMWGFMLEFWSTLTPEQKVIFTTTIGAWLVALWYLKPVKWIGVGVTATVMAGAVGVAIALMWPDQQKIKINNKEFTPKDLQDKLVGEIENPTK